MDFTVLKWHKLGDTPTVVLDRVVRWVTWQIPYGVTADQLQLNLLSEEFDVIASLPGAAAQPADAGLIFDLANISAGAQKASFGRLSTLQGVALEFPIPLSPSDGTATPQGPAIELELIARLADGTPTTQCSFDLQVGTNAPATVGPGVHRIAALIGTISIRAKVSSPDHWVLDDAVLELDILGPRSATIPKRHADFKPPLMTLNVRSQQRITCEYFLSRLKDFTAEAQETVHNGSPKGNGSNGGLTLKDDLIPRDPKERPTALGEPVPSFGQFDVVASDLVRQATTYSMFSARIVEIKTSSSPPLGNEPRVVGLCWNVQDAADPAKDFAAGGMDTIVMFSLPAGHQAFLKLPGEDGHQHSFDYLWLYPYWWMTYFVLPTEDGELATPHKPAYPPPGAGRDPFVFLGGGGRFRAGAGVAAQIAATGRPIMGLFPIPGVNHGQTGEWANADGFSEFLYELIAMLRRQSNDYRPLARGDHIKRLAIGGHSRSCTDAVLPTGLAWSAAGSSLKPHFVDAVFLDPPEGSTGALIENLKNWAKNRNGDDTLHICIETKSSEYVTLLGGVLPKAAEQNAICRKLPSAATSVHAAPIRFVYVPTGAWQRAWRAVVGEAETRVRFQAPDDPHAAAMYYGVFPCLNDGPLGRP